MQPERHDGNCVFYQRKGSEDARMTQCNHFQDSPNQGDHPMEETSVVQPTHGLEGKKK